MKLKYNVTVGHIYVRIPIYTSVDFLHSHVHSIYHIQRITFHCPLITLLDTHACMFNYSLLKIDACNIHCVSDSQKFFNTKKFINSKLFSHELFPINGIPLSKLNLCVSIYKKLRILQQTQSLG